MKKLLAASLLVPMPKLGFLNFIRLSTWVCL